jgi:ABC-type Zn uptake system ZnuABC Zn-binding protein ZnuA
MIAKITHQNIFLLIFLYCNIFTYSIANSNATNIDNQLNKEENFIVNANNITKFGEINSNKIVKIATTSQEIHKIILAITLNSQQAILVNKQTCHHQQQINYNDLKILSEADAIVLTSLDQNKNIAKLISKNKIHNKPQHIIELAKINKITMIKNRHNSQIDWHLALNPDNAIIIAKEIAAYLGNKDGFNQKLYKQNLVNFITQTTNNIKNIKKDFDKINRDNNHNNRPYLSFHSGYQYFENYFDIKPAITIDGDDDHKLDFNTIKSIKMLKSNNKIKCLIIDNDSQYHNGKKIADRYDLELINLNLWQDSNINSYNHNIAKLASKIASCL